MVRHVLCFRCVWESTHEALVRSGELKPHGGGRVAGDMAWRAPFGAMSAANWIGMQATRHMSVYGTRREHLGAIALNDRANAARNPNAVYRDPITMDDYLSARMITTPFGLYDCDVPCDGCVAVIVSHADTAARSPAPGAGRGGRDGHHRADVVGPGDDRPRAARAGRRRPPVAAHVAAPSDVDVAELYDGFSFNCLSWIEALGFCGLGEGGPFLEGGGRIALDGELPLNTHGGQLSAGRTHGYGFLHEACVQLRGDGGERQVPGDPEVAVVSTGGGHPGGTILLTRWR